MPEPFIFANDRVYNVEDLLQLCQQFPDEAVNYLLREDFEKWLAYIGKTNLATYAAQARQASVSSEDKLQLFIKSCQETKTNVATQQPVKSPESVSLLSKIIQSMKNSLFGNRQKTQEKNLSTE